MTAAAKTPEAEKPTTLIEALLAAKAALPVSIAKDKDGQHGKYVTLDAVMEAVTPKLTEHGLVWVTFPSANEQGEPILVYQLIHAEGGQKVEGEMPLMLGKSDMQGLGSAITYARRYSIMAVLGLAAGDDDDGTKAAESPRQAPQAAPKPNGGPLGQEARERVLKAIAEKEQSVPLTLAAVGLEKPEQMTADHARQIKSLLDRIA